LSDGLASSYSFPGERMIVSTIRANPLAVSNRIEGGMCRSRFQRNFWKVQPVAYQRAHAIIRRGDHCQREIVFRQLDFRRLRLVNPTRRAHNGRTPRGQLYTSRYILLLAPDHPPSGTSSDSRIIIMWPQA